MKPILIFGTGGHAREVAALLARANAVEPTWDVRGHLVDRDLYRAEPKLRHPVFFADDATLGRDVAIVVAVGAPGGRRGVVARLRAAGFADFPSVVDPDASIGPAVRLAEGCVVFAGAVLTADVDLSEHVHVNVTATVSHDCRLAPFVTLSPGVNLCGNVTIGDETDVGAGAVCLPGVSLGRACVIGAGAVVTGDVPAFSVAVGVPARVVKTRGE